MNFAKENDERQGEIADSGLATGGSMFHEQTDVSRTNEGLHVRPARPAPPSIRRRSIVKHGFHRMDEAVDVLRLGKHWGALNS